MKSTPVEETAHTECQEIPRAGFQCTYGLYGVDRRYGIYELLYTGPRPYQWNQAHSDALGRWNWHLAALAKREAKRNAPPPRPRPPVQEIPVHVQKARNFYAKAREFQAAGSTKHCEKYLHYVLNFLDKTQITPALDQVGALLDALMPKAPENPTVPEVPQP